MSYTINLTNGNIYAVIPDGTINTSSSMTLIGKNYAGYGQFLDDNFIHLLESSADTTAPGAPLTGQLWYNTTAGTLQVYNGTTWVPLASNTSSTSAPTGTIATGSLWYDSTNAQLNVYTGSAWLLVGPVYTAATGVTGAIPTIITDNTAVNHTVVELYVNNDPVGFISKDAAFTPGTAISGFTTIRPGITLSTLVGSNVPLFQGTATSSQQLNGLTSSQFMRSDTNTGTSGSITVGNVFTTASANNNVTLTNTGSAGNIVINATVGNVLTPMITINGTANTVSIPSLVIPGTSNFAVGNIINSGSANTGNIGNVSTPFNTFFGNVVGVSSSALYADVAERFHADTIYEAGTVVELGGTNEITVSTEELSESVFGVISTRAAYLMNSGAGTDSTHPPIAMTGRVPVRSTGIIRKGDRLVSAGNGLARAARAGEATAFNVIGRALADKLDSGLGTVEAIVTIK